MVNTRFNARSNINKTMHKLPIWANITRDDNLHIKKTTWHLPVEREQSFYKILILWYYMLLKAVLLSISQTLTDLKKDEMQAADRERKCLSFHWILWQSPHQGEMNLRCIQTEGNERLFYSGCCKTLSLQGWAESQIKSDLEQRENTKTTKKQFKMSWKPLKQRMSGARGKPTGLVPIPALQPPLIIKAFLRLPQIL